MVSYTTLTLKYPLAGADTNLLSYAEKKGRYAHPFFIK